MEDDAQRILEQKALTNVRGLVDKLEAEDQAEKKLSRNLLLIFAGVLAVVLVVWLGGGFAGKSGTIQEVVIAPAKPAK